MKYLLKTVDAGEKLNKEVDLFGTTEINELEQTQQQHQETAQRVDAVSYTHLTLPTNREV